MTSWDLFFFITLPLIVIGYILERIMQALRRIADRHEKLTEAEAQRQGPRT